MQDTTMEDPVEPTDSLYSNEKETQKELLAKAPWKKDPNFFQEVRISSLALTRMALHAQQGGQQEIMGVLTGKIVGRAFIVLDCYGLPVEATETRVNAMGEAYEYMVQYLESQQAVGRADNICGWYHSHPNYGCWLSRIDVGTQEQNQAFQDPFLAIVVDPMRTQSSGTVEIGAFRTYPQGYKNPVSLTDVERDQLQDLYGPYWDRYYPLKVSYFSTSLDEPVFDLVWNRYWTELLVETSHENSAYELAKLSELSTQLGKLGRHMGDKSARRRQGLQRLSKSLQTSAISGLGGLVGEKNLQELFGSL